MSFWILHTFRSVGTYSCASIINESFTNLDFRFKAILKSTSKDCKKKLFEQIVQKNLIKSKDNKDASVIMVTDYLKKYFQI